MSIATDSTTVRPTEQLGVRLRTGITWNLVSTIFNQGSTFVVNIIVANLFGRQRFGEYSIIMSTILTLANVAQLAIGYTATRYIAEFRSTDQDRAGRILGLCSIVSVMTALIAVLFLLVNASWLATLVLRRPDLAQELMIGGGAILFTTINGYLLGALAGLESFKALGKAGIISGSSYVMICGLAAWTGGLRGVLVGLVVSSLLQWVVLSWLLSVERGRAKIVINYYGVWQEKNILFKFALPAALSSLVTLPSLWLASAFLVRQPAGYEQLALYSAATSFRVIVLFLPNIFHNVGMALLNNQKGIGERERYQRVFVANIVLTMGSVLIGASVIILFGPWLLGLFGKSFSEGYTVLLVLMLSTLPEALAYSAYQILISREKMWLSLFAIVLPQYGIMIILAFLLTPIYGAVGLAAAYAAGWFVTMGTVIFLAWQDRSLIFQPKNSDLQ